MKKYIFLTLIFILCMTSFVFASDLTYTDNEKNSFFNSYSYIKRGFYRTGDGQLRECLLGSNDGEVTMYEEMYSGNTMLAYRFVNYQSVKGEISYRFFSPDGSNLNGNNNFYPASELNSSNRRFFTNIKKGSFFASPDSGGTETPTDGDEGHDSDDNSGGDSGSIWNSLLAPINEIKTFLIELPDKFIELLKDMSKFLFVPSEDYFATKFNEIKEKLALKLKYDDYINVMNSIKNLAPGQMPNFTFDWMGRTYEVINWKYLDSARTFYYFCIRGVFMFLLLKYNYNQIYRILRNTDLVGTSSTMYNYGHGLNQMKQNDIVSTDRAFKKVGFK